MNGVDTALRILGFLVGVGVDVLSLPATEGSVIIPFLGVKKE